MNSLLAAAGPKTELHWHRLTEATDHWRLGSIVYSFGYPAFWSVYAVIKCTDGRWCAQLTSNPGLSITIIRCRNLHEAADCARRWAEYRGFKVASRFPEGRGHE